VELEAKPCPSFAVKSYDLTPLLAELKLISPLIGLPLNYKAPAVSPVLKFEVIVNSYPVASEK
jgi:hypothetical protein